MIDKLNTVVRNSLNGKLTVATSLSLIPRIVNALISCFPHIVHEWTHVSESLPEELDVHNSQWSENVRPSITVIVHRVSGVTATAWWSYVGKCWTTDDEVSSFDDVDYWHYIPKLEEMV